MTASADGAWFPDGAAVEVKKGDTAGESGFFCEGCVLAGTGATAPAAGKLWVNPHSAGTAVSAGATNSGPPGMFCPGASGSSTSGSSGGASTTTTTGGGTTG